MDLQHIQCLLQRVEARLTVQSLLVESLVHSTPPRSRALLLQPPHLLPQPRPPDQTDHNADHRLHVVTIQSRDADAAFLHAQLGKQN